MAVNQYKAHSFDEYVKIVTDIGYSNSIDINSPTVLWSRGQRVHSWNLVPTLQRVVGLGNVKGLNSSERAMEEEIRKQHYVAKNYHFFSKEPQSNVEWLEVMQHHGVKTRMLDWSESALHSLIFALECFFNDEKFRKADRIESSPCVWVFEPISWNMCGINKILQNDKIINSCLDTIQISAYKKKKIKQRLQSLQPGNNNYMQVKSAPHLKGIFNLSYMKSELQSFSKEELLYILEKGELYYCLFYVLLCIYLTTQQRKVNDVMPLSIVESYHSERIKEQKGSFTIFPYYEEDEIFTHAKALGIPLDALEYMNSGNGYLHKILLCDQEKIAFQVMNAGLNISWLYPELPVVANAIEARKIFI